MTTLILIMGDQLLPHHPALSQADPADTRILMVEATEEISYVPHHRQKIVLFLSAMRHYAQKLRDQGWQVDYFALDDPIPCQSFTDALDRFINTHAPTHILCLKAGEWRVENALKNYPITWLDDPKFIAPLTFFNQWIQGRKQWRMEYFYRAMRKQTGLLLDRSNKPIGGQWNYDQDNRQAARPDLFKQGPLAFPPDPITLAVIALVQNLQPDGFGKLDPFDYAVTAEQAEQAADHFIAHHLPHFGTYQDAMLLEDETLYHSRLSAYLNIGLLDPLTLCKKVETAYHQGHAPLNAAEGFIRQIIGWREYMRGLYWHEMPDYVQRNALKAQRPLPQFYWNGDTKATCLKAAITQTINTAYAHHIQRLMITGNFALLWGVDPQAIHQWYLGVYSDALEWVELPNTLGMSQFADGGIIASKPYISSGRYIQKMSNYCQDCFYDVSQKTGPKASPFNSLYWHFLWRHHDMLSKNPRLTFPYKTWAKMNKDQKQDILDHAEQMLADGSI